jgi:hypothetical protein
MDLIGAAENRTFGEEELSGGEVGSHMEPDDGVHILHRPLLDHAHRSALPLGVARFLRGLEEKPDPSCG